MRLKKGQKEILEHALAVITAKGATKKMIQKATTLLTDNGLNWLDVIEYNRKRQTQ